MTTRMYILYIVIGLAILICFAFVWAGSPPVSHAEELAPYTADDTHAAIDQMADEVGVPAARLEAIVDCETGGTFDPYSRGRNGELGAAQLKPDGELPRFYAWGYTDPFSPYQAVRFLGQRIVGGGAGAWSCAR